MQLEKAKALGSSSSNYSQPVRWLVIPGTAEVYKKEEMEKKRERKIPARVRVFLPQDIKMSQASFRVT